MVLSASLFDQFLLMFLVLHLHNGTRV